MKVAEIFGPTIQGEGPSAGRQAAFVRLSGCNLTCSWCDTPYTWDATRFDLDAESSEMSIEDIVDTVFAMAVPRVVITGGEPLMQPETGALIRAMAEHGMLVEVETNGTIRPPALPTLVERVVQWNVSPKLTGSGVRRKKAIKPDVLQEFARRGNTAFKFVISDLTELIEVDEIFGQIVYDPDMVFLMPQGTDAESIQKRLVQLTPAAIKRGFSVSTRLHVMVWGDERGR